MDQAHGHGEKTFNGKDRHRGYYRRDKRHGYGEYFWHHGDKFEGTWVNGELRGKGSYYYGDHSVYQGKWERGVKHGEGIFTSGKISNLQHPTFHDKSTESYVMILNMKCSLRRKILSRSLDKWSTNRTRGTQEILP